MRADWLSMGPKGVISAPRSRSARKEGSGGEFETSSLYVISSDLKSFLSRLTFLQLYASILVWTEHSAPSCERACARRESSGISRNFMAGVKRGSGWVKGIKWLQGAACLTNVNLKAESGRLPDLKQPVHVLLLKLSFSYLLCPLDKPE